MSDEAFLTDEQMAKAAFYWEQQKRSTLEIALLLKLGREGEPAVVRSLAKRRYERRKMQEFVKKKTQRDLATEERRAAVKARWDKGLTVAQIAERLGYSKGTVRRDLETFGVNAGKVGSL